MENGGGHTLLHRLPVRIEVLVVVQLALIKRVRNRSSHILIIIVLLLTTATRQVHGGSDQGVLEGQDQGPGGVVQGKWRALPLQRNSNFADPFLFPQHTSSNRANPSEITVAQAP